MAYRTDLPKIPMTKEPTIWNGEMAKWATISSFISIAPAVLIGGAIALASIPLGLAAFAAISLVVPPVGAILGGIAGKKQMEKERLEGKTVKEPTYWNTGVLSGMYKQFLFIGLPTAVLAGAAGALDATIFAGALSVINGISAVAFPIYGGLEKKSRMKDELNQALELQKQQEQGLGVNVAAMRTQERGPGMAIAPQRSDYVNSVTPQEYALMQERIANKPPRAEQVAEQRLAHEATAQPGV